MSKSLISILLPVHEDSPFLEKCLLSLNELALPALTELLIIVDRVSNRNLDLINNFNSPLSNYEVGGEKVFIVKDFVFSLTLNFSNKNVPFFYTIIALHLLCTYFVVMFLSPL
jgi:hypothetical protein